MNKVFSQRLKAGFWAIFSIVAGVFLASLVFKNVIYEKISGAGNITITDISSASSDPGESQYYFVKDVSKKPIVSAEAYLVGDLDTGEVILFKNKDKKFPIASVSKLMTALVTRDVLNPEDVTQVSAKALSTYGENGDFHKGENIKIGDLLYPLLMESSNDAAEILAEHIGRDSFIRKMNQEAEKLEMTSTSYSDPSGLSEKNQSTVSDLFKLAGYLKQKNQDLYEITKKRSYNNKKHSWFSNNQFLHDDGYLGGKSGYIDEAKQTVISTFSLPLGESGSRPIAITLLRSNDRHSDVENIVKYLKKNIYYGGEKDANTAWVKEKEGLPDIRELDFVTLLFGGDIMLDRGVKNSVMKNFGGDYSALFEKLDILKESDFVFANLEGPASDKGEDAHNLYSFRMDPSVIPALRGAGIDILSVANNHVADWGREAYTDTLTRLKENEILYAGGGMSRQEAEAPTIVEKYSMKIGFLGFSDKGPNYAKATDDTAGLLIADNPRFDEIVQNASKQVDYLVVSFHFGEEYQTEHNERQEYLAHKAIDDGAKIVIGAHPHVIEDTEVYKNGFIAYSLGNFIFDQWFSEKTKEGMLLKIKLERGGGMTINKNIVKLNSVFQPDQVIRGKDEKVEFKDPKDW